MYLQQRRFLEIDQAETRIAHGGYVNVSALGLD
jgi:hypothetical protein